MSRRHVRQPRHPPRHLRPSVQARSAATVQRIADATRRLLAKKDFDSIQVDEIVQLAGTSKGAFYFRFATKSDLLRFLAEETFTALSSASSAFFEDPRTRKLALAPFLAGFIEHVAAVYVEQRNLLRAFLHETRPGGDPVVVTLLRSGAAESVRMLSEGLGARRREIRHPDPNRAIATTTVVLGVLLRSAFLFPEHIGASPGMLDDLPAELRRMLDAYLRAKHR